MQKNCSAKNGCGALFGSKAHRHIPLMNKNKNKNLPALFGTNKIELRLNV